MADTSTTADEPAPETAQRSMDVVRVRPEDRLRVTMPGGEVTEWVRAEDFQAVQDRAFDLRRTLALAHMLMSFGDWGPALRKIESDTGLTIEDARVMRGILAEVQARAITGSPGGERS